MAPGKTGGGGIAAAAGDDKAAGPLAGTLLYRDRLLLVLNKPAGLAVHAGPSGQASVEDHLPALRFGYHETPALAHRLDRDTSGCLALGRNARALAKLGRLFSARLVEKRYWAVVTGRPPRDAGTIALPLTKRSRGRQWRMEVDPTGQPAVTHYRLLGRSGGRSWLELTPETGRTHQIRVHLAALGCPLLGDATYGSAGGALHLHAVALRLPLYPERPVVAVAAPPPAALHASLAACGWRGGVDSPAGIAQETDS